jgi:hypothetical protein
VRIVFHSVGNLVETELHFIMGLAGYSNAFSQLLPDSMTSLRRAGFISHVSLMISLRSTTHQDQENGRLTMTIVIPTNFNNGQTVVGDGVSINSLVACES